MRIGLTLPSFVDDPDIPIGVARAAEAAGVNAVFAYDHLFRIARDGTLRPAIECAVMLGAVAAETERIALGTLVARASLRPPATLRAILDTVARIAGPRLLVGIGAGDEESRAEMETFGLGLGSEGDRVGALRACVRTVHGRGYPVWVGGRARHVGLVAAELADGWNRWGASLEQFAAEVAEVRDLVERLRGPADGFTPSWGGLVVLGEHEMDAAAKAARLDAGPDVLVGGPEQVAEALRAYSAAGAAWGILAPVDASNAENAMIVGELVVPLLAD